MTKHFRLYYFLMYLLISGECFENNSVIDNWGFVPRVVNGIPAKLGDAPYQVAFKVMVSRERRLYRTFCGGTIVGSTKLVSAAHCFELRGSQCRTSLLKTKYADNKQLQRTRVVAGNLWNDVVYRPGTSGNGQWRILKSMAYPGTYKFPKHDISVGFTTVPFVFNADVKPIPYATKHQDFIEKTCMVSGYGRINKYERSDRLLIANLTLMNQRFCSVVHRQNMDKFICTRSVPSDIEKGDSGGPLICDGKLVGVVSGYRERAGSFFTRVSSFSDFLDRNEAIGLRSHFETVFLYVVYVLLKFYCYFDCVCCLRIFRRT